MSTDPSKVNALRKLTEAAEATGWSAGLDDDGDPMLTQPAKGHHPEVIVYVAGGFVCSTGQIDVPADLMALLLEASR